MRVVRDYMRAPRKNCAHLPQNMMLFKNKLETCLNITDHKVQGGAIGGTPHKYVGLTYKKENLDLFVTPQFLKCNFLCIYHIG